MTGPIKKAGRVDGGDVIVRNQTGRFTVVGVGGVVAEFPRGG